MKNESKQTREDQAVDALAAAALRQGEELDVSQEEIDEFLKDTVSISPAGKQALEALGPNVVSKIIGDLPENARDYSQLRVQEQESCAEFVAMHRKNQTGENELETERELERKREEILRKLKTQKDSKE
jgi:hypothetical protein